MTSPRVNVELILNDVIVRTGLAVGFMEGVNVQSTKQDMATISIITFAANVLPVGLSRRRNRNMRMVFDAGMYAAFQLLTYKRKISWRKVVAFGLAGQFIAEPQNRRPAVPPWVAGYLGKPQPAGSTGSDVIDWEKGQAVAQAVRAGLEWLAPAERAFDGFVGGNLKSMQDVGAYLDQCGRYAAELGIDQWYFPQNPSAAWVLANERTPRMELRRSPWLAGWLGTPFNAAETPVEITTVEIAESLWRAGRYAARQVEGAVPDDQHAEWRASFDLDKTHAFNTAAYALPREAFGPFADESTDAIRWWHAMRLANYYKSGAAIAAARRNIVGGTWLDQLTAGWSPGTRGYLVARSLNDSLREFPN